MVSRKINKLREVLREDVIQFVRLFGDVDPLPYQEKFLKDSSNYQIFVGGRRVGKCVSKSQPIYNPYTGEIKSAEEWYRSGNLKVVAYDENTMKLTISPAIIEPNGKVPVYYVRTNNGHEIYVSHNHPVLTNRGWVFAEDLRAGDWIATTRYLPCNSNKHVESYKPILLGFILADGHFGANITFVKTDEKIKEIFKTAAESFDNIKCVKHNYKTYRIRKGGKHHRTNRENSIWKWLHELGYDNNVRSYNKYIAPEVFTWDMESIALLLKSMFTCDGYVDKDGRIEYTTISKQLAKDVQHLLLRFGIRCSIRVGDAMLNGRFVSKKYRITITDTESIVRFREYIGSFKDRHIDRLYGRRQRKSHNKNDVIPFTLDELRVNKTIARKMSSMRKKYFPNRFKLRQYAYYMGDADLIKLTNSDIFWSRVEIVEYVGVEDTYEIEVPRYHTFVLDGIITHNSFVVSMKALHYAWTHPYKTVLVVSASKEQAQETFRYITTVINRSSILKSTLQRKTQTEIEFDNGSRIKVVPAGESGKSVRGYTADMVIIDEAAYVPDAVFDAIEPTIATQIKKGSGFFILLGSPAEPKGAFYEAWNSDIYSKHHATTYDNPYVDEKWIEDFKRKKPENVFKQEILGEFATTDETFFNIDLVRKVAIGVPHKEPDPDYDYYFGIDFAMSGKDETVIAIVGIDNNVDDAKLEMVKYYSYKSRTPSWIVWKIKELAGHWRPKRIYVDSTGLGYPIYQMLKEKLGDFSHLVHGINFSTLERDEMFYLLRKLIEDEEILLLDDNKMLEQFLSYTVKVRADGQVRIAKKKRMKDDITDALALAVWGFKKGSITYTYMPDIKIDDLFSQRKIDNPYRLSGSGVQIIKF